MLCWEAGRVRGWEVGRSLCSSLSVAVRGGARWWAWDSPVCWAGGVWELQEILQHSTATTPPHTTLWSSSWGAWSVISQASHSSQSNISNTQETPADLRAESIKNNQGLNSDRQHSLLHYRQLFVLYFKCEVWSGISCLAIWMRHCSDKKRTIKLINRNSGPPPAILTCHHSYQHQLEWPISQILPANIQRQNDSAAYLGVLRLNISPISAISGLTSDCSRAIVSSDKYSI